MSWPIGDAPYFDELTLPVLEGLVEMYKEQGYKMDHPIFAKLNTRIKEVKLIAVLKGEYL